MFFLLLASVSSQTCPSYQCSTTPSMQCVTYNSLNSTSIVSPCPSGYYCPFNYTSPQTIQCAEIKPTLSYPGESCSSNSNCSSGLCFSNKTCSGKQTGVKCNDTLECSPGLYCKSTSTSRYTVCSPLIQSGLPGCTKESDCTNLAYCNFTGIPDTSYCLASLSFRQGTQVSACYNGINYICQNLLCVSYKGSYYCGYAVNSINLLPTRCSSNRDCQSSTDLFIGTFYYGNCTCGVNSKGTSYCPPFPGDVFYQSYIFYLNLWMNSEEITRCNSKRRMELNCIKSQLSTYQYNTLIYYMYMVKYYPYILNNQGCVKSVINNVFWGSEEYMADQKVDSFSEILAVLIVSLIY